MHRRLTTQNQEGFSLIEMMIAVTVMVIITGAIVSLMRSSMMIATASYEMTDAQESLRTAQEYINRDLMNAGDGLKSIVTIRAPLAFVNNYLTLTPIVDADMPVGMINLGILTSDNAVPANTAVVGSNPATTVRSTPGPDNINGTADDVRTDRQTILELDPDPAFPAIPLPAASIDNTGTIITLPAGTVMTQFTAGEIYYVSSSWAGGSATFATVTAVNTGTRQLTLANGGLDVYGLNLAGNPNNIKVISNNGLLATSLQRMWIIHYYVNSSGFLMRRVFGARCAPAPAVCAGFRESIISEHVMNVQFNYSLDMTDGAGNVVQPVQMLTTKDQRLGIRAVEVTVTVETPHVLQNGIRSQLSMTTSTSVRNMQFRRARQPVAP
jgi:type IV pilus assembly protein PilW